MYYSEILYKDVYEGISKMPTKEEIIREFFQKRAAIQDEILWVGCNPSIPEMYKKQCEEGFKLMRKMNDLAIEYNKKLNEVEDN